MPLYVAAATAGGVAVAAAVEGLAHSPKLGLGAVAALAVVLVSIQRPTFGLFVLVALTFSHGFIVIHVRGGVPSAAFPFAVLLVVFAFFGRDADEPFLPRSAEPAFAAFAAYGAWLVATAAWARDPVVTLHEVGPYWKLMLMVVAVLALVRTRRMFVVAMWAIIGSAAILASMTVAQHFSPGLTFFGFALPPVYELTSTGEAARAVGPVGNPNAYAQMLVVAVPFAFARLVCERRLALRILAAASILLSAAAVYFTFSRGGFVGLAVVLVLCLMRYRARIGVVVLAAALILLLAGPVSGTYSTRLGTLAQVLPWHTNKQKGDLSIEGRAAFLRAGLHLWRDHPLGGVGYANYPVSYQAYNRGVGTDPTLGSSPHDTPVEVLSETGVVGLALWLILFVAAFARLRHARSRGGDDDGEAKITADYLAIALVGYLVTGLFLGATYALLLWLLLAVCFSMSATTSSSITSQR